MGCCGCNRSLAAAVAELVSPIESAQAKLGRILYVHAKWGGVSSSVPAVQSSLRTWHQY
ncbi:MAG: hypothetical protein OJF51_003445 [Nitrospira sp.]|jgi:hypothetical protein|nr:MAG: hypothetical protein OJF51_003445 [Nitrospira sp.]